MAALGGAATVGTLMTVGAISGPAGWAAIGAVGTASMIVGGGLMIGFIFAAKEQQGVRRPSCSPVH